MTFIYNDEELLNNVVNKLKTPQQFIDNTPNNVNTLDEQIVPSGYDAPYQKELNQTPHRPELDHGTHYRH